jgi:Anti-sigma-K factor rskA/Putative zinc-finger
MSVDEFGSRADADGCGGNAAPYVLGALTEQESEAFRRHVESCAVCREEVAALQVVADALPATAPQLHASPELKRRVMSSVRQDARRRGSLDAHDARATRSSSGEPASGAPARARAGGPFERLLKGLRPRWQAGLAVGALAAALVAVAVVALGSGSGATGTRVIDAQVLAAHGHASLSVSGGHAELSVTDMPPPGAGRVYEVWRERSGTPQPTDALFSVTTAGDATVSVPGGVSGVHEVLVTSEPQGGSRVPTRSPVIVARVS